MVPVITPMDAMLELIVIPNVELVLTLPHEFMVFTVMLPETEVQEKFGKSTVISVLP